MAVVEQLTSQERADVTQTEVQLQAALNSGYALSQSGMTDSIIVAALRAIPKNRTLTLSSYGATEGADITAACQALIAAVQDGDHVVFDVAGTYTATAGLKCTRKQVHYSFTRFITVTALDHTVKPYFLQVSGYKKHDLTLTSGDITEGDTSFDVADATDINPGDVIYIHSNAYFNGTGANGDPICYKSIIAKVRNVSGNTVNVIGQLTMSIPAANITALESWRGGSNCVVSTPKLRGPGIQATIDNGAGSQGIDFNYCTDGYVVDIDIAGFQNRQVGFTNCFNTWAIGGVVSSGLADYCATNFYGVVHQGGTHCVVKDVVGYNLRRAADTGTSHAAVNVHHQGIIGIDCNGSAVGTHHCYNYVFNDIQTLGANGGGFTFRAKNIRGQFVGGSFTPTGSGIGFGSAEDSESSCGDVTISGIDINAIGASHAIKIFANGRYDLQGNIKGGSVANIFSQAEKIGKFKFRGTLTKIDKGIVFNSANPTQLDKVDIKGVEFLGGTGPDIVMNGPTDPQNRALKIQIEDNTSTAVSQPMVHFATGYFEGLSVRVLDNLNLEKTTANGTALIDFGSSRFTTAPEQFGNRIVNAGERDGRTENTQRIVGEYEDINDIPSKTTLLKGAVILIANASVGGHPQYIATSDGTTGVLSGVTGSISSGTKSLTLSGNGAKLVDVGCILVIPGAGSGGANLISKVADLSSDGITATIVNNAGTTVSGATLAYKAPTLSGSGAL